MKRKRLGSLQWRPTPASNFPPTDFGWLAEAYPALRPFVHRRADGVTIDFTDPAAQYTLTQTILQNEYGVSLMSYHDAVALSNSLERESRTTSDSVYKRLIPPVPNRVNYINWLNDLFQLKETGDSLPSAHVDTKRETKRLVLDVGVGASCIYPLLGRSIYGWGFIGSDVDDMSLNIALRNLDLNTTMRNDIKLVKVRDSSDLQRNLNNEAIRHDYDLVADSKPTTSRIKRYLLSQSGSIASILKGPVIQAMLSDDRCQAVATQCMEQFYTNPQELKQNEEQSSPYTSVLDACMSNPPFYDIDEKIQAYDSTICTGADVEMKTMGGETAFIAAIIADSLILRQAVKFYTCMTGKRSSVAKIIAVLRSESIPMIFSTKFVQGRTMRWGIAWSFLNFQGNGIVNLARSKRRAVDVPGWNFGMDLTTTRKNLIESRVSDEILNKEAASIEFPLLVLQRAERSIRDSIVNLSKLHPSLQYNYFDEKSITPVESDSPYDIGLKLENRDNFIGLVAIKRKTLGEFGDKKSEQKRRNIENEKENDFTRGDIDAMEYPSGDYLHVHDETEFDVGSQYDATISFYLRTSFQPTSQAKLEGDDSQYKSTESAESVMIHIEGRIESVSETFEDPNLDPKDIPQVQQIIRMLIENMNLDILRQNRRWRRRLIKESISEPTTKL